MKKTKKQIRKNKKPIGAGKQLFSSELEKAAQAREHTAAVQALAARHDAASG